MSKVRIAALGAIVLAVSFVSAWAAGIGSDAVGVAPIGGAPTISGNVVDWSPMIQAGAHWALVAVVSVIAAWTNKHLDGQANERARQAILDALENAAGAAQNQLAGTLKGQPVTSTLAGPVAALMFRYAKDMVPGALQKIGMTDQQLAKAVVAKMPPVEGSISDAQIADISKGLSGQAPPAQAPDYNAILQALLPELARITKGSVDQALAAHYGKQPPPSQP